MKQTTNKKIMKNIGEIILQPLDSEIEFSKFTRYGKAPTYYDKLIFMDKEQEKEWEQLDESTKQFCLDHLKETCSKMENKLAIELLCHIINDMSERIKRLEKQEGVSPS